MSNKYTTFNSNKVDALKEPMFLGEGVNIARYDVQKHSIFETLMEKQLSFFWRPEEIDVSKDRIDYIGLPENEKHIFISNLRYQIVLDSVQGKAPNIAFLPIVSIPELESWISLWSMSEVVHSRSYTHIIRNIVTEPNLIFDEIVDIEELLVRAADMTEYYDDLIDYSQKYQQGIVKGREALLKLKKKLYLCIMSVNILEGIRFYVSFACSYAFAERKLMEGNAKIIQLINRDENLHMAGTQQMLKIMRMGYDDPDMESIALECEAECIQMFKDTAEQEKQWAKYLFKDGSMLGLNENILNQYIEYITNLRMKAVDLEPIFEKRHNPLPWIDSWQNSRSKQVAPQETEITTYLVGQIDSKVDENAFDDFDI